MRKLAVFTEGSTELVFMKRLLEEIAGRNNIVFEIAEQKWKQIIVLESPTTENNQYFVLLVNCRHDDQVVSFVRDRLSGLISANYDLIVGLRDVYPRPRSDFQFLKDLWNNELDWHDIPVEIFASVMEIEAWFIQECTHFERYDPVLTMELIENSLGFNPSTEDAATLDHPSDFLNSAYMLAGHSYSKKAWQQRAVVDHLDFDSVYLDLPQVIPELERLIDQIDQCISAD